MIWFSLFVAVIVPVLVVHLCLDERRHHYAAYKQSVETWRRIHELSRPVKVVAPLDITARL